MIRFHRLLTTIAVFTCILDCVPASAEEVSFSRDIRPLLSARCFACHGPDEQSREAGLRLDQADGPEGAIGFVIEPGSVEDSELWNRITTDDPDIQMPPPDSHLKPLSEKERSLIRQWIEADAPYENFWAFTPAVAPTVPTPQNTQWSDQPIDAFVLRKIESQNLTPADPAEPRTLLRRVTYDLTGLPPTRDEIREFLAEYAQSSEQAYRDCVDRLISRPQYGEHMSRYWLDLVRFADTNGMHKDFYRNHVAYRDWVIRSFNDNLPYDDFVRYQLAGDLFPQPTDDQFIASGFNRLHLIIDRGTALPEESRFKNGLDRVTAVSTAFLGLTAQCAQCHDHKFDPITQKEFYSLYAFFDNLDAEPETERGPKRGLQAPFMAFPTAQQKVELAKLNEQIASVQQQLKDAGDTDENAKKLLDQELKSLQQQRDQVDSNVTYAMVMRERSEIEPTHVRNRGLYDSLGEEVERTTPAFLPQLKKSGDVATRMDLAEWFVAPENPLTARVAVNRFWQQLFGTGLVKTSEDLGNQGEVPSHPELLDYLTVSFVGSGWDIKSLVKKIVLSKTYRQASTITPDLLELDPGNRLLARGARYRLDAEVIRDTILATSGLLNDELYGPSVKPPQPPGLWEAVSMIGEVYRPDKGDAIYRRSMYTFWKRAMPPPQMTILNAPIRDACIARRERTNTPLQALLLLNEPEYMKAAGQLAAKTLAQPADERIAFAWETVTSRLPDDQEREVIASLLADLTKKYAMSPDLANQICDGSELDSAPERAEHAAWTIVANTLYNLDITKTKD